MSKYRISIALCTYNGGKYLTDQLDSIARQNRVPDEIIICDDGSTDNSLEIINKYQSSVPFDVRLYSNKVNLGVRKNFEKAISLCRGDIIFLCDQDDHWHYEKIKIIENIFLNSKSGMVFTNAEIVDENLKPLGYSLFTPYRLSPNYFGKEEQEIFNKSAFTFLMNHYILTGATMAFRSNYKNIILPIPEIWDHDRWIGLLIAAQAPVTFVPDSLIQYRQHSENQVGGPRRKITALLSKAKANGERYYQSEVIKNELLYYRLSKMQENEHIIKTNKFLHDKLLFLKYFSKLPKNLFYRVSVIIKALLNKNYFYYSWGWHQAFLDVFFYT